MFLGAAQVQSRSDDLVRPVVEVLSFRAGHALVLHSEHRTALNGDQHVPALGRSVIPRYRRASVEPGIKIGQAERFQLFKEQPVDAREVFAARDGRACSALRGTRGLGERLLLQLRLDPEVDRVGDAGPVRGIHVR